MPPSRPGPLRRFNARLLSVGAHPGESVVQRGRRRVMVGALGYSLPFVVLAMLGAEGPWVAAALLAKAVAHCGGFLVLTRAPTRFRTVFRGVFATDLVSDVVVTVLLGGLYASGLQVGWSLIVVLGALVAFSTREAAYWFVAFLVAVAAVAVAPSFVDPRYVVESAPEAEGALTIAAVTILTFLVMAYFVRQRNRYQQESDDLLHNILPDEIAERLKSDPGMIAEHFEEVTVLFADVVGFTPMSATMQPTELVGLLDDVFTDVDGFVEEQGLEKIKTVGDEYMVAAGVPRPRPDHARAIADLALRIRDHVASKRFDGHRITFRIGINSGPVVAGIIGRRKFAYDLWGDVVNTASRMESHGEPGKIQISAATYEHLKDDYRCERRGPIDVKGKGVVETWFLTG